METIKTITHSIDIAGNAVPIDYDYLKHVATITNTANAVIPVSFEQPHFETLISLSGVSGFGCVFGGHTNPKSYLITKATYSQ
jgi:hypothetical protein